MAKREGGTHVSRINTARTIKAIGFICVIGYMAFFWLGKECEDLCFAGFSPCPCAGPWGNRP